MTGTTAPRPAAKYTALPSLGFAQNADIAVSFEFFPPKTEKMDAQLWTAVERLAPIGPNFVSVTYGAGGSTRDRTHAIVRRIQDSMGLAAAAHLTCVDASRAEIDTVAQAYWAAGIRHIVALRGDPPGGFGGRYTPREDGYAFASDLVEGLRRIAPFEISVGAYPETHPEAPNATADIDNLKRKVDAGATRAITQFFFDVGAYERFLERCASAGITIPIVPGILPVSNVARTRTFAAACGASIPSWVADQFEGLDADPETRGLVATTVAVELCRQLYALGVRDFHFYTLNRAELVVGICHMLGVRAPRSAAA